MFAILIHIYYEHTWEDFLLDHINNLGHFSFRLLINVGLDTPYRDKLIKRIKIDRPDAIIIETPNKGKDIGGKLALLDLFFSLKMDQPYLVFLHDKVSPQGVTGSQWRNTLLKIVRADMVPSILKLLDQKGKIGLIGAKEFLLNEYDEKKRAFDSQNSKKIEMLLRQFNMRPPSHSFIGGTMFWGRTNVFRDFFSRFPPLECRKILENGNVLDIKSGTFIHAWERLFSWIALSSDYEIKAL